MYTVLDFSARGNGGKPDKVRRHYAAVLVGGPENAAETRWMVKIFDNFRHAKKSVMEAYRTPERFPAAIVVTKQPGGEFHPALILLRELTGWADGDGWNCWGGAVLADSLWLLENEGKHVLDPGREWCCERNPESPGYPCISPTDHRHVKWPQATLFRSDNIYE